MRPAILRASRLRIPNRRGRGRREGPLPGRAGWCRSNKGRLGCIRLVRARPSSSAFGSSHRPYEGKRPTAGRNEARSERGDSERSVRSHTECRAAWASDARTAWANTTTSSWEAARPVSRSARLTEDEDRQVLLIEAGPGRPGIADVDRLGDQMRFAATLTDWAIDASYISGGAPLNYPQGRKMGGGSAVNGAFAVRGVPDDYERWAAIVGEDWSWPNLLRVLCRLESDQDFGGEAHGTDGPVPVVRWRPEELLPDQHSFRAAVMDHEIPWVDDLNAPGASGIGSMPMNRRDDVRMSTALTYLPLAGAAREPGDLAGHRGDPGSARAGPRDRGGVPARRSAATGTRLPCDPLGGGAPVADAAVAVRNRPCSPPR